MAVLSDEDIEALAKNQRVIRNRRKLEALVGHARRIIDLVDEHGTFKNYFRSHDEFDATVKGLRKQFKFLGDMGCYHFMYVVGEDVPPHEEWRERTGRSPG